MRNAELDESQAGIKIVWRNKNKKQKNPRKLRYANNISLMAESGEDIKSLLMRGKEERETAGLKLNIQ